LPPCYHRQESKSTQRLKIIRGVCIKEYIRAMTFG
jgi:hypothetical protein